MFIKYKGFNFLVCFFIVLFFAAQLFALSLDNSEYGLLAPAPSSRLKDLAESGKTLRENNQRLTGALGGTLFLIGAFSPGPVTKGVLQLSGLSNLFSSYILGTFKTAEERSWEKVQKTALAPGCQEKLAAEEIMFNAEKSRAAVLKGPRSLSVIGTGLLGSYLFFSGNTLGAFTWIGTYACFPKNEYSENQAEALQNDIRNTNFSPHRIKLVYKQ